MARLPVDIAELSNRNELPTGAMQVQQATAATRRGRCAGRWAFLCAHAAAGRDRHEKEQGAGRAGQRREQGGLGHA